MDWLDKGFNLASITALGRKDRGRSELDWVT